MQSQMSSWLMNAWIGYIFAINVIHSRLTFSWCIKSSWRSSWTLMHKHAWSRGRVCRMIELHSWMSMSNFLAMTMWLDRLWKQKEIWKFHTMMARRKMGFGQICCTPQGAAYNHGEPYRLCLFLQEIKSTQLEAAVNVVWAQQEKYGKDFDVTVSYLDHMVMKKSYTMLSIHIAKTRSQSSKPKVATFMEKIELKKYSKAVWNSMSSEQQMQVRKLWEMQGIKGTKPTTMQISAETRIVALEAQLGISSQPSRIRERLPKSQHGEKQRKCNDNLPGIRWKMQGTKLTPTAIKRGCQCKVYWKSYYLSPVCKQSSYMLRKFLLYSKQK